MPPTDTEILDWIEENEALIEFGPDGEWGCEVAGREIRYGDTVREAVAAAMDAEEI